MRLSLATAFLAAGLFPGLAAAQSDELLAEVGALLLTTKDLRATAAVELKDAGPVTARAVIDASLVTDEKDAGCGMRRLSLQAELKVSASLAAKLPKNGSVSLDASKRTRRRYETTMPADLADAVKKGRAPAPNPFDLDTLRPGTGVKLVREDFESLGGSFAATFGRLDVSWRSRSARQEGTVVSVTRVDDHTVRVLAGPHAAVQREEEWGLGIQGVGVSVGVAKDASTEDVARWEFDVSTKAGRDAYEELLATGSTSAGSQETVSTAHLDRRATLAVKAKGVGISGTTNASWQERETTRADGTRTVEVAVNDRGAAFTVERDYAGDALTKARVDVPLGSLTPEQAELLANSLGKPVGTGQQTLSLTEAEARAWHDRAKALCARDPHACTGTISSLAAADSLEMAGLLLAHRAKDKRLYEDLQRLTQLGKNPLPGATVTPGDPCAKEPARLVRAADSETSGSNVSRNESTRAAGTKTLVAGNASGAGISRN